MSKLIQTGTNSHFKNSNLETLSKLNKLTSYIFLHVSGMRFALLELKALLASVISHYKITSMVTPEEIKFFAHVMIRSQNGIHVKIEKRDLVA